MRKKLVVLLAALLAAFTVFAVGCGPKGEGGGTNPAVPTNVRVEATVLKWNEVADAASYTVKINDGEITGITAKELDLSAGAAAALIAEGDNAIKVKAVIGDKASEYSEAVNYKFTAPVKLVAPTLAVDGRTVSWTAVANAVKYEYKTNDGEWAEATDLSVTVPATVGTYIIKVRAKGNGTTILNSDEASKTITVTKLVAPTLTLEGLTVSWTAVDDTIYLVSTDGDSYEAANGNSYTLVATTAGTYTVYVRAMNLTNATILPSDPATKAITVVQLAVPTDVAYAEGVLTWSADDNSTKFEIVVTKDGIAHATQEVTDVKLYEFNYTAVGVYTFTVKAVGATGLQLDSAATTAISVTVAEITKLSTPTNFAITGNVVSWNRVPYATGYKVVVSKTGTEDVIYTTANLTYTLPTMTAGDYKVKVCATATGITESDYTTAIDYKVIEKLGTSSVTKEGYVVSWTAVPNAIGYHVWYVSGGETTELYESTTETSYTFENLTAPLVMAFHVVALGNDDYEDGNDADQAIILEMQLTAPVETTKDDTNRKLIVAANENGATMYRVYPVGEDANKGEFIAYPTGGIPYGNAGNYVFEIYYKGNADTGWTDSAVYSETYEVTIAQYTLTLQSGNGITFEGGAMDASLAEGANLPALVKVASNDREIIELYNVATPTEKWTVTAGTSTFTMPAKAITIAPVYQRIGQLLNLPKVGKEGASANSGQLGDKGSADMLADASVQWPIPQTIFSGIDGIIKDENGIGEKGVIITAVKPTTPSVANPDQTKAIPGITDGGSFFRVKTYMGTKGTAEGVLAKTYTFHFNFQNYDTEELNFEVIQVRGGTDMGTNQGAAISEMITLAPGAGKRVSLTITFTDTNDNGMTIIRFKTGESHEELKLGMSMSKVNPVA